MLWDSGHRECWNACASVSGSKGLGLKWICHWCHASCISRNSISFKSVSKSVYDDLSTRNLVPADYMSSAFSHCDPSFSAANKKTWGCRNSFYSQIVLALVVEVNELMLEFTFLIIDLGSYLKSHYFRIRNGKSRAWWKMIAFVFAMLMIHSLVWDFNK